MSQLSFVVYMYGDPYPVIRRTIYIISGNWSWIGQGIQTALNTVQTQKPQHAYMHKDKLDNSIHTIQGILDSLDILTVWILSLSTVWSLRKEARRFTEVSPMVCLGPSFAEDSLELCCTLRLVLKKNKYRMSQQKISERKREYDI